MPEPVPSRRFTFQSSADDISEYHALSALAVAGLLLGAASMAAMLTPLLWIVPWAAIVVNGAALRRIARYRPVLGGRRAALAGLALAVVFAVAAPVDLVLYQRLLSAEAQRFAAQWFEAIRRGEPHKAHYLTTLPNYRQPMDDGLWDHYRQAPRLADQLRSYVEQPVVRTLLALGPKAEVRFYETAEQGREDNRDWVELLYAVTYPEEEGRKTFFVALLVERIPIDAGRSDWRLVRLSGGVRPSGW